jgi:hypothetical protein
MKWFALGSVTLIILLVMISPAGAEWLEGGKFICDLDEHQLYARVAAGHEGISYVVWTDFRSTSDYDIYAQKLDSHGKELWTVGGIPLLSGPAHQIYPRIISDGEDGFIIIWEQQTTGPIYAIKAQKYDVDGSEQWNSGGVTLVSGSVVNHDVEMISDGLGGIVVTWYSDAAGSDNVYAQRVDSDGNALWGTNGTRLCDDPADQTYNCVCPDGSGGAIVAWYDFRGADQDIYAQRILSNGMLDWTSDGTDVCTASGTQRVFSVVETGNGGAYIIWEDGRGIDYDIYAQRLSSNGYERWATDGIPICSASGNQDDPAGIPDGEGGAIVVWGDGRNSSGDIYAQRIDLDGNGLWVADGTAVCLEGNLQFYPDLMVTESGNVIVAWIDYRYVQETHFTQMLDLSNGLTLWDANGVHAGHDLMRAADFDMCSDGTGGAVFVFDIDFDNDWNILAQRIERNGYWGYPSPVIADVRDVPSDQGGAVDLAWYGSRLDPWPDMGISHYTVWRAISHPEEMPMFGGDSRVIESACEMPSLEELSDPMNKEIVRLESVAGSAYFWSLLGTVEAYYLDSYSYVAATLFDSTASSNEYSYFQVIAHGGKPSAFWISRPDSGYSVDNIAPCPPLMLSGEQSYVPEGLELSWTPNTEPDLDCYNVYRGIGPSFVPYPGNLLTSTCDTLTFDGSWSWDGGFCYKVAAVDVHGNESDYSVLCDQQITGDDPISVPDATFLKQNFPNPFNPSTTITFGLKEKARVSLNIYDAAGRLVRVLVDESRPAGRYEALWNGLDDSGIRVSSGVYFYRLAAGEFLETRKMVLLR